MLDWRQEKGFKNLFQTYYASLCQLAWRFVQDEQVAEDMVQEVFVKLWEHRNQIEISVSIKAYLYKSVVNRALGEVNRIKPNKLSETLEVEHSDQTDALIQQTELAAQLQQAIYTLPEQCRAAFILCKEENLSYKEAAEMLNISEKTVENQMGKALKLLREKLQNLLSWVL